MFTASFVRAHFMNLPENTMVTRRDLLHYGTRWAVDSIIRKLKRQGIIVRVCCGVYLRPHPTKPMPKAAEIAAVRIAAFHRTKAAAALDVAKEHGLKAFGESKLVYEVNASTSQFRVFRSQDKANCIVYLRSRVARKMKLDRSVPGRAIKALWLLGEGNVTPSIIQHAARHFCRADRIEFRASIRLMPGWLSDPVYDWFGEEFQPRLQQ